MFLIGASPAEGGSLMQGEWSGGGRQQVTPRREVRDVGLHGTAWEKQQGRLCNSLGHALRLSDMCWLLQPRCSLLQPQQAHHAHAPAATATAGSWAALQRPACGGMVVVLWFYH